MPFYAKALLAVLFAFLVPGTGLIYLGATVVGSAFTVATLGAGLAGNFLPYFLAPAPAAWFYLACIVTLGVLWVIQLALTLRTAVAFRDTPERVTRFPLAAAVVFVSTAVLIASGSLRSRFGVAPFDVSSDSLAPEVLSGDRILVRALPPDIPSERLRGAAVLYRRAEAVTDADGFALWRVVAVMGDRVVAGADCSVRVGAELVVPVPVTSGASALTPCNAFEGVLSERQLFLVGSAQGADSRRVGPASESQIVGRPFVVWFSQAATPGGLFRRIGHPIP